MLLKISNVILTALEILELVMLLKINVVISVDDEVSGMAADVPSLIIRTASLTKNSIVVGAPSASTVFNLRRPGLASKVLFATSMPLANLISLTILSIAVDAEILMSRVSPIIPNDRVIIKSDCTTNKETALNIAAYIIISTNVNPFFLFIVLI